MYHVSVTSASHRCTQTTAGARGAEGAVKVPLAEIIEQYWSHFFYQLQSQAISANGWGYSVIDIR